MDTSLFDKAAQFAIEDHRGTERRGKGFPFIIHPMEAATIVANITNKGNSMGDIIYLFVNGTKTASALSDLEYNQSGDLTFIFTPKMGGNLSISLSVNEDGSAPL